MLEAYKDVTPALGKSKPPTGGGGPLFPHQVKLSSQTNVATVQTCPTTKVEEKWKD